MVNTNVVSLQGFSSVYKDFFNVYNSVMTAYNVHMEEKITIGEFTIQNRHYIFNQQRIVDLIKDDNKYYIYDKTLEICSCGYTQEDALKEYYEMFDELYTGYALESDEDFDNGAKQLKQELLELCTCTEQ